MNASRNHPVAMSFSVSANDFDSLVNRLPVAVYRTTPEGRFVAGNPALVRLIGAGSFAELAEIDVTTLYVERTARSRMMERVARGIEIPPEEIELKRLDGTRIWVRVTSRGVYRQDGSVEYFEGVLEDVTALREAKEREVETAHIYRAIVRFAVDGVVSLTEDGAILALNPAAERMSGYREEELIGRDVAELLPPETLSPFLDLLQNVPRDGATTEIALRHRSGDDLPVEVSLGRSHVNAESLITAVLRDISERKVTEAALRSAKETAERINRSKDQFLASMSHELRTPLNAVIGLAGLLTRQTHGPLNEKQQQYLSQIEASGQHLLSLINDILDLAKIEADKLELELEPVDVAKLVEECVALVRESVVAKEIRLSVELERGLPALIADRRRTKQVVLNLLSNAAKFTPAGGSITVGAHFNGREVVFSVADTGEGIDQHRVDDLFVPFEQLDSSLARSHEGTGLGLALSKQFVELQGGTMEVESELGKGSTFSFRIPIDRGGFGRGRLISELEQISDGSPAPNVLVVEDNAVNRMLITDYLEAHGFNLDVAVDGDEALQKARSSKPDVILMDIQLPKRDGLSVTRELKADPGTNHIPIIALTALAMKGDASRCLEAGCDAYLSKPCDPQDVLFAVEKSLS